MKTLLNIIAAFILLQSCAVGDKQELAADSTVYTRDTTITAANSYSDLFLDSNAITSYIQQQKVDEAAAQRLRNFYNVRNNQFAWFHSQGLTEEGRSFWTISSIGGDSASKNDESRDAARMKQERDSLLQKDSMQVSNTDTAFVNRELALTHQFILWAPNNKGAITASNMYYVVPRKRIDPMQLADSIVNKQKDSALAANTAYAAMKQQLSLYFNAAKNGGWQPIPGAKGLKKGVKSPTVTALKKRLQSTNDYVTGDTTGIFSDSLATAIKEVQLRHGLAPTGTVNDSLVAALNVAPAERVQQLLLNMNRMMWMQYATEQNRIEVNLPSQTLYAYEGSNKTLEMPVIIGREGTNTVAFSGKISQLVFNPTWNVPPSIVKNELLPKMKADPNYLKKNNMERVGGSDSVPVIRQLPGKDNPLGKVKFLFPNTFDIYLHDTPDKSLFQKKDRALSHGCIRVANAEQLAAYLLKDQKDWTPEKIRAAMNSGKEETVKVNNPQAVQINYFSAWVDATGKVHFRNDIGGRDKATYARLFTTANAAQDVASAGRVKDSLDKAKTNTPATRQGGTR